jgi:hypothetical protein
VACTHPTGVRTRHTAIDLINPARLVVAPHHAVRTIIPRRRG